MTYRDIARLGGEGILEPGDIPELSAGVQRVLRLMSDYQWHSREEILDVAGTDGAQASEGLRRLRELRRWYVVDKMKTGGRNWAYRLGPELQGETPVTTPVTYIPSPTIPLNLPVPKHPIWDDNRACTACELRQFCQGPVPAEGYTTFPFCGLMIVGEAPGRWEDRGARPFVGPAGEELEQYLWQVDLRRGDVFISNTVKCRPSGANAVDDWAPDAGQVAICTNLWLEREIALVKPKVILALGATAARYLLRARFNLAEVAGIPQRVNGRNFLVVPSFHPAAALYKPDGAGPIMRSVQLALKAAKAVLDGTWVEPVDKFPDPWYLAEGVGGEMFERTLNMGVSKGRLGIDTEFTSDGTPLCLSMSGEQGSGVVVMAEDKESLARVNRVIREGNVLAILHSATADIPVLRRMGVRPKRIYDTQYMLYWQGETIQGLKPTARRRLGVEMEDYADVVREAQRVVANKYLEEVATRPGDWPDPEPVLSMDPRLEKWERLKFTKKTKSPIADKTHPLNKVKMKVKVQDEGGIDLVWHQPQNIVGKVAGILRDMEKGRTVKGELVTLPEEIDPVVRWRGIPVAEREVVEREMGPMPVAGLESVPREEWVPYAARDADIVLRLWEEERP